MVETTNIHQEVWNIFVWHALWSEECTPGYMFSLWDSPTNHPEFIHLALILWFGDGTYSLFVGKFGPRSLIKKTSQAGKMPRKTCIIPMWIPWFFLCVSPIFSSMAAMASRRATGINIMSEALYLKNSGCGAPQQFGTTQNHQGPNGWLSWDENNRFGWVVSECCTHTNI